MIAPRPLLLDLFCGAGGAAQGYVNAGFRVVGVDHDPLMLKDYPFQQLLADWRAGLDQLAASAALIHASPPCQAYSYATRQERRATHPDLLPEVREALIAAGKPYVIENVPGAPLINPIELCGTSFRLPVIRHRLFECSFPVDDVPDCGQVAGQFHEGKVTYPYASGNWHADWACIVVPAIWPWMSSVQSGQAIPPSYTEFIARQWLGERIWMQCPACGQADLREVKMKLVCPMCGYVQGCCDPALPAGQSCISLIRASISS